VSVLLPAALLAALPAASDQAPRVTVTPEQTTVSAVAASLSDLLDQLARQTGMKVTYEGGRPRLLVGARVQRPTPAEAILALLEGQGVAYAMQLDETGTRVVTLLVLGGGPAGGGTAASSTPAAKAPPPTFDREDEPEMLDEPIVLPPPAEEKPDPQAAAPQGYPPTGAMPQSFPVSPFAPRAVPNFPVPPPGLLQKDPSGMGVVVPAPNPVPTPPPQS
jgi:hypothetical protein